MMNISSLRLFFLYSMQSLCFTSLSSFSGTSQPQSEIGKKSRTTQKKHAGWRSMPYILEVCEIRRLFDNQVENNCGCSIVTVNENMKDDGNETLENLATFGLMANFMIFLMNYFHLPQVSASVLLTVWGGTSNLTTLVGAYIADSYLGKFRTLVYSSITFLMGLVALTLVPLVPKLHPPKCTPQQQLQYQCIKPTSGQMGFLFMSLGLLSIGSGGIRPCSLPFGADQFDFSTEEGRKGINSYFNWYYFSYSVVNIASSTIIVFIQDRAGWSWGFGILTFFMFCSIILFFVGMRFYIYVPPGQSIFATILQVFVSAYKKRGLNLPSSEENRHALLYDPPLIDGLKSSLTPQFRWLTKAAIIIEGEVKSDGSCTNKWRLCSIQQVEEVKVLVHIIPVWISTIICFLSMTQQSTIAMTQAKNMDHHLGHFQIPTSSIAVISNITLALWLPIWDSGIVPTLQRITKIEGGLTLLQRMGLGLVFSILAMVVSGLVEEKRRASVIAPISIFWLTPQLVCMGFANAFAQVGTTEFLYKEFPDRMKSVANSLFFFTLAVSGYLNSLLLIIINIITGKHGQHSWLDNNINVGRLDYWYYFIAGLGVLNFVYFLICANRYHYKKKLLGTSEGSVVDMQLNSSDKEMSV